MSAAEPVILICGECGTGNWTRDHDQRDVAWLCTDCGSGIVWRDLDLDADQATTHVGDLLAVVTR